MLVKVNKNTMLKLLDIKHRLSILWPSLFACILVAGIDVVTAFANTTFTVALDSKQEVSRLKQEKNTHKNNATGNAQLIFEPTSQQVCYTMSFERLVGTETEVHVHAPAPKHENAPVLFFIAPEESGGSSPLGSPKKGCLGPLNSQELRWLKQGLWYLNIHTDKFPGGQIRGQVLKESD